MAACSADSGPKEAGGTVGGAVAGAAIGNAVGGAAGNRVAGTLLGAAFGGLLGNRIGAALDDEDRRRAYAAQMQALETGPSGAPVACVIRTAAAMAMSCLDRPTPAAAG